VLAPVDPCTCQGCGEEFATPEEAADRQMHECPTVAAVAS
jgi:hypothetical protein